MVELIEDLTILLGESHVPFMNMILEKRLTAKQIDYLSTITRLGNPRLGDLARELGLSSPSITAIIKRFVDLGFVEKTPSEDDKRSFRVRLTEKGRELEKMHQQSHMEMAETLIKNL
ncbi:MAG: MarR family transcriptional regulator [Deltaproteobacteria bacterium]|uniref:MarR family transcriptional regulator n=1 Tax=Candidatus Zymogenus saltonus TaxID=2844893 RepID=A0A9D8KGG1_9DELT|nr:MarR family transcriptional regulator [Candidatus Zymogenus saltonus]